MKTRFLIIILGLAIFLSPLAFIKAAEPETGNLHIKLGEIVNKNLYVFGEEIIIDGDVGGDLIVGAQKLIVNGRVEGDIIAFAEEMELKGEVSGDVRIAGGSILINGKIGRNLNVFGSDISIGPETYIAWDAYVIGSSAKIEGIINGNLKGRFNNVIISAQIAKDLNLKINPQAFSNNVSTVQTIILTEEAVVNGNFTYSAPSSAEFSQTAIAGETTWLEPEIKKDKSFLPWLWKELFLIFSALVVGLVLISIGRKITQGINSEIESEPFKIWLPGILIILITPLLVIALTLTMIGLPLALILFGLWLIALYVSRVLVAILMGQIILKKLGYKNSGTEIYSLITGVIITWLLFSLPYVGWLICLIATSLGLGGIWNYVKNQSQNI